MEVLHKDANILTISKPSGLLAQPASTNEADVLARVRAFLATDEADEPFVGLVHRLDRPTSGIMVLARSSEAARTLSKQFRERTVEKQYLAVVEGELRGVGTWRDYLANPEDRPPSVVDASDPEGKLAELSWQGLCTADERSLLLFRLRTGRSHQIRLQAAERGYPVVGDTRYGAAPSVADNAIALHHTVLRIEHPAESRRTTFVDRPPSLWASLLSADMETAVDRFLQRARP